MRGIFHEIFLVPQNIVKDMNIVKMIFTYPLYDEHYKMLSINKYYYKHLCNVGRV